MTTARDAITALHDEWSALGVDERVSRLVLGWLTDAGVDIPDSTLAGVLDELAVRDRQQGRSHSDVWLGALLRRAVREGAEAQLAARVVVQAMLPHAARTARSLRRPERQSFDEVAQAVVASLYATVRCYPLDRRPERIAANLALDTRKATVRELRAEWTGESEPTLDAHVQTGQAAMDDQAYLTVLAEAAGRAGLHTAARSSEDLVGARGELLELLLWALEASVLTPREATVLEAHFRDEPVPDVATAREAGVREATVRQWRSRAVRRLQGAAVGHGQWVQAA